MKGFFLASCILYFFHGNAQPVIPDHAIIYTRATFTLSNNNAPQNRLPGLTVRDGLIEGDNGVITYFTKTKMKITSSYIDGPLFRGSNSVIINKETGINVNLVESMGVKSGFYATEENVRRAQKFRDSVLRKPFNTFYFIDKGGDKVLVLDSIDTHIEYIEENKKIAGFNCKKALIKTTHYNGSIDSLYVWYCPDFKLSEGFNVPNYLNNTAAWFGFEKLNGFPMKYEVLTIRGDRLKVEVKKINMKKPIKEKEFKVPKGYNLKPVN